jgi:hypothetical protein
MIEIVTGGPLAGKSTYVRNKAKRGDIIIDLDEIARAFTITEQSHDYPHHIRQIAIQARQTAINMALSRPMSGIDVYIIHADPSPKHVQLYQTRGAKITRLTLTIDQINERMATRPDINKAKIIQYYNNKAQQAYTDY